MSMRREFFKRRGTANERDARV